MSQSSRQKLPRQNPVDGEKRFLFLGLLILVTGVVYSAVLNFGLVNFDDPQYIRDNAHVLGGLTLDNMAWAFTSFHAHNWHPLTWLSLQADVTFLGGQPWAFHFTNLLLHTMSSILLFLALLRMTGRLRSCFVVALLFAIHPLHVESVAWLSERKDVLSGFFWMVCLWVYAKYALEPTRSRYLQLVTALVLGLMAKPMLVTLPFVLLLLDYWLLQRFAPETGNALPQLYRLAKEKLPLFLIAMASSGMTFLAQSAGGAVQTLETVPVSMRLQGASTAYAMYLGKMFWPTNLILLYPYSAVTLSTALISVFLLLVLTSLALRWYKSHPYALVGWLWYLGTLVPVIGLVQVGDQAMADRYTYIPSIGISLAVVWLVSESVASRPQWRRAVTAFCSVLMVALCLTTIRQIEYWLFTSRLWRHTLELNPDNVDALINLKRSRY